MRYLPDVSIMTSLFRNRESIKLATANIILVANAFIWYLIAFATLKVLLSRLPVADDKTLLVNLTVLGANAGAIALAGLVGTFVVGKYIRHERFLYAWIASGIVLSLLPLAINVNNLTDITILSIVFGTYFGIGMPATIGYHSGLIKVENRAKVGGVTFLLIGIVFAMTSLITETSVMAISIVLVCLRIIALITFRLMNTKQPMQLPSPQATLENKVTYRGILSNRSFIFYFVPWLMFTLINYMTVPIQNAIYPTDSLSTYTYTIHAELEAVVTAVSAVISGFVADRVGRKRLSIIGFIMLGVGYAAMGFASSNLPDIPGFEPTIANTPGLFMSSIIFTITDGIAWGIFYVLFLFTLWGDLAHNRKSDKFYFLGALPYVSAYFMQLVFEPLLADLRMVAFFSFASIFLFLAVLPLIYAPETLPEKVMKDRDLKSYVERAKQKAQKEAAKAHKTKKTDASHVEEKPENKPHESGEGKEYDDAVKLAEKYY